MKSNSKKIIILFIGLLIAFSLNNTLIDNNGVQNELSTPEQSAGYGESFIHVDGNWTATASTYDWCSGDGSWNTPYIIENVSIDASSSPTGSGIFINNSLDVYFSIRNCTIYNSGSGVYDAGIKLVNVTNGKIVNNTCSNNGNNGIHLMTDCNNNTIANNIANNNGDKGIDLLNNCYENIISNNTVNNNDFGITLMGTSGLIGCDHNDILNNTAINNGVGIHLSQSDFNTVYGNRLVNNSKIAFPSTSGNGIRISYYEWGGRCRNNSIENNQILLCRYGIFMYDGVSNKILNNTINNNTLDGMYIRATNFPCVNNTIENNTISYNQRYGMYLVNTDYSNITDNTINENNQHGIYFSNSDNSNIINNTINDNTDSGLCLRSSSDNNVIKNNTINRNDLGIALDQSDYNNVSGNTLKDNNWCIYESFSVGNVIEYNDCSPPTVQEPIFINAAATGVGAHNWTWAISQSWCSGSGSWNDPYLIENLKINGFGFENGIEIWNSNVSFIIRDCLIYNSDTGIYLENVNNSRLINNNCSNLDLGIYIEYSTNNTISGNTANDNNNEGIFIFEGDYNYITGNTVNDNYDGIYMDTSCDNNFIGGNTANDNTRAGIFLYDSDYNNITGNNANGCNDGIYLEDGNDNNLIMGNSFNNNQVGIEIYYGDFNTIIGNTANDNSDSGISLEGSNNNTVSGNTANNNDLYGVYLHEQSSNNTILGNSVSNNNYTGIYLTGNCVENLISGNTANDNDNYGIYLTDFCDNNTISGNKINGNGYVGIHLNSQCSNNLLSGNTANYNNNSGIYLEGQNNYNVISENTISNNNVSGIIIESSSNSNNTIYGNFFLINGIHALDNGTNNEWNCTTIGNYWDNHTGPDTTPHDGIVDTPYTHISGSAGSIDYLPIAEDGAPSIAINSPVPSELFDGSAPSFNVRITDEYLDAMWYTLDGGLHNYSFTVNRTIDQSAWDALSDGSITLTIYASDIPGNIGSATVNIVKDATGPIIVITSPVDDEEFGTQAPLFNITITDDHLDSIWYSLDGGVTTYAIITNATIDQTAWAALSEGSITITFYANDTLGNEASEDVIITKSIPPVGDDPTIVIVIVVVSIVGGVAVLAGVYLFMKKRGITE